MAEPLRHRQTKEAATDMFSLQPTRHISTLHECDLRAAPTNVRSWESNGLSANVAFGPFMTGLHRVHWGKEASSLRFAFPYWSIRVICHWIIDTMVEVIIRRWCCHVGGNNFVSRR